MDNATIFIHSRFEQEEHVYLYDDDETTMYNIDQQLAYQTIKVRRIFGLLFLYFFNLDFRTYISMP